MINLRGCLGRATAGLKQALIVCVVSGCVGVGDFSQETYRQGVLKEEAIAKESIAILPMMASGKRQTYLPDAEAIFLKALLEMRPNRVFLMPSEGLLIIKKNDLYPLLLNLGKASRNEYVVRESDLRTLQQALRARFFLQVELQQMEVVEGATHARVHGRLWDAESGKIVWEAIGESRGDLLLFLPRAPASFEMAIEWASRGLIRRLP